MADAFDARRTGFEAEYFHKKDAQLVDKLKAVFDRKLGREELRQTTGIGNEEVLDRLLAVNARGELLLAFRLYPLVEIAWADGSITDREVKAVIDAAVKLGVPRGGAALQAIEEWLARGPKSDSRTAWYAFAAELRKALNPTELATFRHDLLEGAKAVAKASGGVLGFGETSSGEKKVLDAVNVALSHE